MSFNLVCTVRNTWQPRYFLLFLFTLFEQQRWLNLRRKKNVPDKSFLCFTKNPNLQLKNGCFRFRCNNFFCLEYAGSETWTWNLWHRTWRNKRLQHGGYQQNNRKAKLIRTYDCIMVRPRNRWIKIVVHKQKLKFYLTQNLKYSVFVQVQLYAQSWEISQFLPTDCVFVSKGGNYEHSYWIA